MELGIPLGWSDRPTTIGKEVRTLARRADDAGLDSLWTADHLFQIPVTGLPRESAMLECQTTLAYVAGRTERIRIGAMVSCVAYRHPAMLVKAATALDVLSDGRAIFGVGAGWDVEEARALGIPFPPTGERFEHLEELLEIAHRMWAGDEEPFVGRHHRLERPLNAPNSVQRPRPPVLVGGSGERRTLRLVARYADACNLFDLPAPYGVDLRHKLDVLRGHCETVGRDPAEIEVTVVTGLEDTAGSIPSPGRLLERIERLGSIGVGHVVLMAPGFEWGSELDTVLAVVDDVHAIEPAAW